MKHFLLASAACLVLGACSSGTSTSTLTLPQVQAQAAAIRTGIDAANNLAQSSAAMTPAAKLTAAQAAASVDAAESAVAALTATGSVSSNLVAFDQAASAAMPALAVVFAVNPATAAAIELGLGLKDAFIGGVGATATLATTTASTVGASPGHVAPPVPVPLPTRSI